jgi:hypothetical protein
MALIRIPALIALLVASGPLQWRYAQARFVLTQDGMVASIPPWIALVALAVVFILVAGYRRDVRHATPILAFELLVAFVIAIVPPLIWAQVAGGAWNQAMGGTTGASYAQLLALVWFLLALRTLRTQRRAA